MNIIYLCLFGAAAHTAAVILYGSDQLPKWARVTIVGIMANFAALVSTKLLGWEQYLLPYDYILIGIIVTPFWVQQAEWIINKRPLQSSVVARMNYAVGDWLKIRRADGQSPGDFLKGK